MSYTSLNGFKNMIDSQQKMLSPQSCQEISVKFAGEEAKDKLYEPKHKKKLVRVLTVIAYVFFVSLAAIMLSMYYIFLWNGDAQNQTKIVSVRFDQTPLLQELAETRQQLEMLQQQQQSRIYVRCDNVVADMQQQITAYESESEEDSTSNPTMTTTEEEEDNTTWPEYSREFDQKRKRSVFMKKIMNFKYAYDDDIN